MNGLMELLCANVWMNAFINVLQVGGSIPVGVGLCYFDRQEQPTSPGNDGTFSGTQALRHNISVETLSHG